jgi:TonB family protein
MKSYRALLLLFPLLLASAGTAAAGNDLVLEINVFQGFRASAPAGEPSSQAVVVIPPDPGWSGEIERQRQQIAETLGLDGVTIIGKQRLTSSGSARSVEFVPDGGAPFSVLVRFTRSKGSRIDLDIDLREKTVPETSLASFSVSGEIGKTFIVGGRTASGPLLVSVTPREPMAVPAPPEEEKEIHKVGGEVQPPTLLNRVEPRYPEKLKADKKSGVVVLQATIDRQGSVVNAVVVRHAEPEFDGAALEAVRQWQYAPATLRGKPVAIYLTITVSFRLQ